MIILNRSYKMLHNSFKGTYFGIPCIIVFPFIRALRLVNEEVYMNKRREILVIPLIIMPLNFCIILALNNLIFSKVVYNLRQNITNIYILNTLINKFPLYMFIAYAIGSVQVILIYLITFLVLRNKKQSLK
jgi:hypothetical protein